MEKKINPTIAKGDCFRCGATVDIKLNKVNNAYWWCTCGVKVTYTKRATQEDFQNYINGEKIGQTRITKNNTLEEIKGNIQGFDGIEKAPQSGRKQYVDEINFGNRNEPSGRNEPEPSGGLSIFGF